jgi:putative iron-only hydrogenase system regulator
MLSMGLVCWGGITMEHRLGVIGIVIEDMAKAPEINRLLSAHNSIIIGRMGVPRIQYKEQGVAVISLIVQGTTDEIGALTGKIGSIKGIQVKSALSSK